MLSLLCALKGLATVASLLGAFEATAGPASYDPLFVSGQASPQPVDFVITDGSRQRHIPVRAYLPPTNSSRPLVMFSHALGGSRASSSYLGKHWASRGYVVVYVQHPGSDETVWKKAPVGQRWDALKAAASVRNFMLRVQDIAFVLDRLVDRDEPLHQIPRSRFDLEHVGISGHSFGAITAQWLSGQTTSVGDARFTDPRLSAALMMSPSRPRQGTPAQAFGKVSVPWMLMTGTQDSSRVGHTTPKSRLEVFPALPLGDKYQLVLFGAEHDAFTDWVPKTGSEPRSPNHHRAILALSTAFWDAHLRGNRAARQWLRGEGPRAVLETRDTWQLK